MEKIIQLWKRCKSMEGGKKMLGWGLERKQRSGPNPRRTKAVGGRGSAEGAVAKWEEHKVGGCESPCESQMTFPQAG